MKFLGSDGLAIVTGFNGGLEHSGRTGGNR